MNPRIGQSLLFLFLLLNTVAVALPLFTARNDSKASTSNKIANGKDHTSRNLENLLLRVFIVTERKNNSFSIPPSGNVELLNITMNENCDEVNWFNVMVHGIFGGKRFCTDDEAV